MSIVWQMFGGNDFKGKEDSKKEVRFLEKQLTDRVTFSNAERKVNLTTPEDPRTKGMSWIQKGGVNRDHSVLMELQLSKVRRYFRLSVRNIIAPVGSRLDLVTRFIQKLPSKLPDKCCRYSI